MLKIAAYVAALLAMFTVFVVATQVFGANDATIAQWAHPLAKIVQKIGVPSDVPEQPNFMNNVSCTTLTYRYATSATNATGCFVQTAYGLVDPDTGAIIMNGTDEAVSMQTFTPHEIIVPWQASGSAIALDTISTGGAQVGLYQAVYESLKSNHSLTGATVSQQFTHPPDRILRFNDGTAVIVNPQTIAFSNNGYWMVAETYQGVFVRINLATLDTQPFAKSYAALGNPALLKSNVAISDNGRYVAIENNSANEFNVYDMDGCSATVATAATTPCTHYNYTPFITVSLGQTSSIWHVRFTGQSLLTFNATVQLQNGTYALSPNNTLPSLASYVALGDSYTSGEGAFDYIYGTDTAENTCHQSISSYPFLLTQNIFGNNEGHSVACSGAVINDIAPANSATYKGQIQNGKAFKDLNDSFVEQIKADFLPGVIAQKLFIEWLQPKIITVSIGGNDIGFGHIISTCVMPHASITPNKNNCFADRQERQALLHKIDTTVPRLVNLYKTVRASSPHAKIYVIGYPSIVKPHGNCGVNVHFSESEITFVDELVSYLNTRIAEAAAQANLPYIHIEHALDGHRLCEANHAQNAVNGLTSGKDSGIRNIQFLGRESYHPNAFGHLLIEQAIRMQTRNFIDTPSDKPTLPDILSDAVSSNKPLYEYQPLQPNKYPAIVNTDPYVVHIDGEENALEPFSQYSLYIDTIGTKPDITGTAQKDGSIDIALTMPTSHKGYTVVHVITSTKSTILKDMQLPLFIAYAADDFDGDQLNNNDDSCPFVQNAYIDDDVDGIDDACDAVIENTSQIANEVATTTTTNTVTPPSAKLQNTPNSIINSNCTSCGHVLAAHDQPILRIVRHTILRLPFKTVVFTALTLLFIVSLGSQICVYVYKNRANF